MQVFREYSVQIMQMGSEGWLVRGCLTVCVCAQIPAQDANVNAYLETLKRLNEKITPYFRNCWQNKWVVSSAADKARAEKDALPIVECPLGDTAKELAEYLLLGVFEPMFRGSDILVRDVEVRADGVESGVASIEQETADQYWAELGELDAAPRQRAAIFSPRKATPERGFGSGVRWCGIKHRDNKERLY